MKDLGAVEGGRGGLVRELYCPLVTSSGDVASQCDSGCSCYLRMAYLRVS